MWRARKGFHFPFTYILWYKSVFNLKLAKRINLTLADGTDHIARAAFTTFPIKHFLSTALALAHTTRKWDLLGVLATAQIILGIVTKH